MKQTLQNNMTLDEISKYLGVTKERIRQIENSAIKKLKHPSISKELREYLNL